MFIIFSTDCLNYFLNAACQISYPKVPCPLAHKTKTKNKQTNIKHRNTATPNLTSFRHQTRTWKPHGKTPNKQYPERTWKTPVETKM